MLKIASTYFYERLFERIPPDHWFPNELAYALYKNERLRREAKKIKFDHGDTLETFIESYYTPNLLNILYQKLMKKEKKLTGYFDPHPACC